MVAAVVRKPVRNVVVRASSTQSPVGEVEWMAREVVARHDHFRGRIEMFQFVQCEDVLVVRGAVPSFYLKQVLQSVLKCLEGVRRIDNQVVVVSCDGLSSVLKEQATCTARVARGGRCSDAKGVGSTRPSMLPRVTKPVQKQASVAQTGKACSFVPCLTNRVIAH
jgi:hypothetical protein